MTIAVDSTLASFCFGLAILEGYNSWSETNFGMFSGTIYLQPHKLAIVKFEGQENLQDVIWFSSAYYFTLSSYLHFIYFVVIYMRGIVILALIIHGNKQDSETRSGWPLPVPAHLPTGTYIYLPRDNKTF